MEESPHLTSDMKRGDERMWVFECFSFIPSFSHLFSSENREFDEMIKACQDKSLLIILSRCLFLEEISHHQLLFHSVALYSIILHCIPLYPFLLLRLPLFYQLPLTTSFGILLHQNVYSSFSHAVHPVSVGRCGRQPLLNWRTNEKLRRRDKCV